MMAISRIQTSDSFVSANAIALQLVNKSDLSNQSKDRADTALLMVLRKTSLTNYILNKELIQRLVQCSSKEQLQMVNNQGISAFDLAIEKGCSQIVDLLVPALTPEQLQQAARALKGQEGTLVKAALERFQLEDALQSQPPVSEESAQRPVRRM